MRRLSGQRETKNATVDQGLTFLVRLTNDMGLEEVQEYANKLKKAEKMREVREQVSHFFMMPHSFVPMLFYMFILKKREEMKSFMFTAERNNRNWPQTGTSFHV